MPIFRPVSCGPTLLVKTEHLPEKLMISQRVDFLFQFLDKVANYISDRPIRELARQRTVAGELPFKLQSLLLFLSVH
jgi:hypothetical protein